MRARDVHLRAAALAGDFQHVDLDAVVDGKFFIGHLLVGLDDALRAPQLHIDVAVFHALDDGGEDLVFLLAVFVVDHAALGLAQMLHDHLLGGLRGDAAKVAGRDGHFHQVAHLVAAVDLAGLLKRHLALGVVYFLDHRLAREHLDLALVAVDGGAHIGALAVIFLIR